MEREGMTVGGVCSGIGGFSLAFERAGFRLSWECEIDAQCRRLLAQRFPDVPVFEDMTEFEPTPVDILCGGTPCQGFSVAGLRGSLSDERSNLALRFIHIADLTGARIILWENVPGVLSTKDNAFGCFLAGMVGADAPLVPPKSAGGRWTNAGVVTGPKRTAAWRILDAQYLGVAQRRQRVFVVASADPELPFQILFEPEGVRRHSPPSREKREDLAGTLGGSSQSGGFRTTDLDNNGAFIPEVCGTLSDGAHRGGALTDRTLTPAGLSLPDVAWALQERDAKGVDSDTKEGHLIVTPRGGSFDDPIPILEPNARTGRSTRDRECGLGIGQSGDPMFTLGGHVHGVAAPITTNAYCDRLSEEANLIAHTLRGEGFDASEDRTGRGTPLVPFAFDTTQITSKGNYSNPKPGDAVHPLASQGHPPAIAFSCKNHGADVGEISPTLRSMNFDKSHINGGGQVAVAFRNTGNDGSYETGETTAALTNTSDPNAICIKTKWGVRRLTPMECERLQGFPDGWTSGFSDSCAYRMLGNAVCRHVIDWFAARIIEVTK